MILLGPKGSGKSFVGGLLGARFGVSFLLVEPLWKAYSARCALTGSTPDIASAIAEIHPAIRSALAAAPHLAVETTGASELILDDLLTLAPAEQTVIIRVSAPIETCLSRIAARDRDAHVPVDEAMIRKLHALSEAVRVRPHFELQNVAATADELAEQLARGLRVAGFVPPRGAA